MTRPGSHRFEFPGLTTAGVRTTTVISHHGTRPERRDPLDRLASPLTWPPGGRTLSGWMTRDPRPTSWPTSPPRFGVVPQSRRGRLRGRRDPGRPVATPTVGRGVPPPRDDIAPGRNRTAPRDAEGGEGSIPGPCLDLPPRHDVRRRVLSRRQRRDRSPRIEIAPLFPATGGAGGCSVDPGARSGGMDCLVAARVPTMWAPGPPLTCPAPVGPLSGRCPAPVRRCPALSRARSWAQSPVGPNRSTRIAVGSSPLAMRSSSA